MTALFEACGKCILTGEHFILYDTPALVLPWQSARFSLQRSVDSKPVASIVQTAWQQARTRFDLPPTDFFPFQIESSIPLGCGFGSSAALCVALLRAAAEEAGCTLEDSILIEEATALEALFHGRSSGLDPTIAVIQQPLHFNMSTSWKPFTWNLKGYGFVLAVTHEERSTADAVARVRAFSQHDPKRFTELNSEVREIVAHCEDWITDPSSENMSVRAQKLGDALSRNHQILSEVGVSSPGLEQLIDVAKVHGALGAKLTGAGLGGGMMAFAAIDTLPHILHALQSADSRHSALCVPSGA